MLKDEEDRIKLLIEIIEKIRTAKGIEGLLLKILKKKSKKINSDIIRIELLKSFIYKIYSIGEFYDSSIFRLYNLASDIENPKERATFVAKIAIIGNVTHKIFYEKIIESLEESGDEYLVNRIIYFSEFNRFSEYYGRSEIFINENYYLKLVETAKEIASERIKVVLANEMLNFLLNIAEEYKIKKSLIEKVYEKKKEEMEKKAKNNPLDFASATLVAFELSAMMNIKTLSKDLLINIVDLIKKEVIFNKEKFNFLKTLISKIDDINYAIKIKNYGFLDEDFAQSLITAIKTLKYEPISKQELLQQLFYQADEDLLPLIIDAANTIEDGLYRRLILERIIRKTNKYNHLIKEEDRKKLYGPDEYEIREDL
jgi:hypothetical protein